MLTLMGFMKKKKKKQEKEKKNGSLYSAFDKCISCDSMRVMIDLLLLTHQTLGQLVSLLVLGVLEKLWVYQSELNVLMGYGWQWPPRVVSERTQNSEFSLRPQV